MRQLRKFFPVLQWLPYYRRAHLNGDLSAGFTVGVLLIPQGMAYALIAGLPPVYGLYAAIVPQLIYAIFGTSRQLSVAPVAMDSLLVAAGVSVMATEGTDTYIAFAILLAFFMGLFQLLLGVFRMGFITNLLSKPVISGFTSAAALIIGLNQLKYLLGIELEKSNRVYEIIWYTIQRLDETHWLTLVIGVVGIIVIYGLKQVSRKAPGALAAVVIGIVLVYTMNLHEKGVDIVKAIPEGLPAFTLPDFSLGRWGELVPLALTISVVAFMEAYSVAKALETRKKDHQVDANQELIGLGAANLIGSLFQAYPVTGGFSRSAVNFESGANTPLASVFSATLVVITLLFLTPLFYYLPTAILAAVIMVAIVSLVDMKYAIRLFKEDKMAFVLLMVTFLVTMSFSMVPGIISGVVLSILILLYHMAYPHIAVLGRIKGQTVFRNVKRFSDLDLWKDKLIMRVDAPVTFINIQYIRDYILREVDSNPQIRQVVIDASAISHVDASAVQGIIELIKTLKDREIRFLITEVVGPVRDSMFKTRLMEEIGFENIYLTLNDALESEGKLANRRKARAVQHND